MRAGTKATEELAGRVHRTGHAGVNSGIGAVAASHGIPGWRAAIALRAVVLSADKHDVLIGEMNAMARVGHGDSQSRVQVGVVNGSPGRAVGPPDASIVADIEIGRASCRERG